MKVISEIRSMENTVINTIRNNATLSMGKMCPYSSFSGPYFPAFGLNTKRYSVSLRIHSK